MPSKNFHYLCKHNLLWWNHLPKSRVIFVVICTLSLKLVLYLQNNRVIQNANSLVMHGWNSRVL